MTPLRDEHGVFGRARNEVHRRLTDEACHEGVGRVGINLIGGANLLDRPFVHDDDAVGEGHGLYLVMGDVTVVTLSCRCKCMICTCIEARSLASRFDRGSSIRKTCG